MLRRSLIVLSAVAALGILYSCGGDSVGPTNPIAGTPTATPVPATTATATPVPGGPAPTPTSSDPCAGPEPAEDCNPGPVASVGSRVYYAGDRPANQGGVKRCGADDPPCYDAASNNDVVFVNEFLIFDITPRNAARQKCCREANVQWDFGNGGLFEHVVGSNKFQYRVYARRRGTAQVWAVVDGVRSAPILNVEIR